MTIEYLHTMVRVADLEKSMAFYEMLGLKERRRIENDKGRFTLVFLCPPGQEDGHADVELTYNWDGDEGLPSDGRHFGHLAYRVDDVYETCRRLMDAGRDHQPTPPRRAHGLRALARQRVGGALAARRGQGPRGALGQHGEHRALVSAGRLARTARAVVGPASPRRASRRGRRVRATANPPVLRAVRATAVLALVAGLGASAAPAECRQALALGLDVSGSVDAGEYALQLGGLAAALESADVRAALLDIPELPVHLTVFEWSGPGLAPSARRLDGDRRARGAGPRDGRAAGDRAGAVRPLDRDRGGDALRRWAPRRAAPSARAGRSTCRATGARTRCRGPRM